MILIKLFLLLIGVEGLRMVDRGEWRGAVFFIAAVSLWYWRPILFWVVDRRWREDFRNW